MNKRKPADFRPLIERAAEAVQAHLTDEPDKSLMGLYWKLGELIGARPEKGAAAVLAGELQRLFPQQKGFSARNVRRMREFYRAYSGNPALARLAMRIGWTQNVLILENCAEAGEREFYLRAVFKQGWSKLKLAQKIRENAWAKRGQEPSGRVTRRVPPVCDFAPPASPCPHRQGFARVWPRCDGVWRSRLLPLQRRTCPNILDKSGRMLFQNTG